jgi:uncharacterized RDD family membrane protein YckC
VSSDHQLRIDTPEQVVLELPVAGVGSRFLAVAVDTVLQAGLLIGLVFALSFTLNVGARVPSFLRQMGPAVSIVVVFCVYWGYFAIFEVAMNGQTPGKRVAHIRVIKESGRPITVLEAITRNVLRAVDFLPAMYGVGVLVMLMNRNSRRLGDFVAGTLVVHDVAAPGKSQSIASSSTSPGTSGAVASDAVRRVTTEELVLIETYLQRQADLDPRLSDEMADQIASLIFTKTGIQRDPSQSRMEFLRSLAQKVRDTPR